MNRFSKYILSAALMSPLALHAQPIKVVASFTILGDLVKQVGGDHIKLDTIVGPDVDLHHFELTPSTIQKLSGQGDEQVKLFFINGLDLEPWANKIRDAADFKGKTIVVSQGVKALKFDEAFEFEADDHEHEHEHQHADTADSHEHEHDHSHAAIETSDHDEHSHAHGLMDPHIWQDPKNVQVMVKNIEQALSQIDSAQAKDYQHNAAQYISQLQALDKNIKTQIAQLPKEKRTFGTNHEAFAYYAKAYGITQIPVHGMGEAEPTAAQLAKAFDELKKKNVAAVFMENTSNNTLLAQVAKDSGIKIGGTLIADGLTASGPTSTYIGIIEHNTNIIINALK